MLWLNVAIAIGFFVVGDFADSNAILANGLDNSSDVMFYALSLLAQTPSRSSSVLTLDERGKVSAQEERDLATLRQNFWQESLTVVIASKPTLPEDWLPAVGGRPQGG